MAGFANDANLNEIVFCNNVDFTGNAQPTAQMTSNGQLLIGSSTAPNIRAGTLTAGSGISILNGNGTITVSSTGPSTDLHTARFIVSAGGVTDGANYTTITSALGAAVAAGGNQTIFIQPGTYTENLTLSANVNLSAYNCDAQTPAVKIIGKLSASFAGTCSISGIQLQTNSDNILSITGSSATKINLVNCYLNATTTTAISATSSSPSVLVKLFCCQGDLGTTGIAYFSISNGGIIISQCYLTNSGGSTTASTIANASSVIIENSLFGNAFTTSNTGSMSCQNTDFFGAGTTLTFNGTGTNSLNFCRIDTAANSAISIGTGVTLVVNDCAITSSNTNAITGLGTLQYSNISFYGTSNLVNTSTQTGNYTDLGKYKARSQSAFLAYVNTTINNVTGDSTAYTIIFDTEVFDQGNDFNLGTSVFTAPVTGKYSFQFVSFLTGATNITSAFAKIVTTAKTYKTSMYLTPGSTANACASISILANMTAGDTASFVVIASDTGGKVDDIAGSSGGEVQTWVSGQLCC